MTEETLFAAALEKATPAEQAAFLDEACAGDATLRRRVEALLASHQHAGFLDTPAAGAMAEELARAAPTHAESAGEDDTLPLSFLAASEIPGSLGRLVHYEVQEVVGKGGMGIVLKAFDDKLHRVVAIKVMAPGFAMSATARKRFVREAQAAAAVRNDHVIDIHAVEDNHEPPYLVMEYIAGQSLQEWLDRSGPLEVKEILRIGMQTAAGLAAAHAQGLIHRDIKPANILLENGVQRVKITDFGLARAVDDASLTQSGVVAGTPQYMSPEQARGEPVDHHTDLFSLGSVLYAMCTGHPPFRALGSLAVLRRVDEDTPRPIHESNQEIPSWLCGIVHKLHAKKPEDRFQSAAEVAEVLGQHLAQIQKPSTASPAARQTPPRRRFRREAVFAAVTVAVLAVVSPLWYLGMPPWGRLDAEIADVDGPPDRKQPDTVDPVHKVEFKELPATSDHPFVVRAGGLPERKFDTLTGAVKASSEGDTIEIRGNGPFPVEAPLRLYVPITIRAGRGFEPVLKLTPAAEEPQSPFTLKGGAAPLVFEGLHFQGPCKAPVVSLTSVRFCVANCRFIDCRFGAQNQQVEVRNCFGSSAEDGVLSALGGPIRFDNNVLIGARVPPVRISIRWPIPFELTRNLLIGPDAVALIIPKKEELVRFRMPVRLHVSANIFAGRNGAFYVSSLSVPTLDELREKFLWNGARNVYQDGASFLRLGLGNFPRKAHMTTLMEWNDFWKTKETGAVHGRVLLANGSPTSPLVADWRNLSDFRLQAGSAGKGAGKDGKDLGPDLDLVGPGPAYERWKKTPEYQQWLKETGQRIEPVNVATTPPQFVVLGEAERKFDTLPDAVKAAREGETIEIRGNGPFSVEAPLRLYFPVIIRAGRGFKPVLHLTPPTAPPRDTFTLKKGVSPVVFEGLEFRGPCPTPAVNVVAVPLYVTNCRISDCVVMGQQARVEARNCFGHRGDSSVFSVYNGPIHFDNNVIVCATAPPVYVNLRFFHSFKLIRNLLVGPDALAIQLPPEDKTMLPERFSLYASENLFAGHRGALRVVANKGSPSLDDIRQRIQWSEATNVYLEGASFLRPAGPIPKTEHFTKLMEWNEFWGLKDTGSVHGRIQMASGNPGAPEVMDWRDVSDFRLKSGSPGKGAGKDGKDLGPDLDLVGPGEAYERWKMTPNYQKWLKDTGQRK